MQCCVQLHQSFRTWIFGVLNIMSNVSPREIFRYCIQTLHLKNRFFPTGNYMLNVNNKNARRRCEVCSKLTKKTPERRQWQWRHSGSCIINFEHILHLALVFSLLTLGRK